MKRGTKFLIGAGVAALMAAGAWFLFALTVRPSLLGREQVIEYSVRERAQLAKLANSGSPIRVGHIPDSPPIDFRVDDGKRQGLTWRFVELLEENTELEFIQVECSSWEEALRNHEIDLVGSIQKTKDREQLYLFSDSYWTIEMVILTHHDDEEELTLESMNGRSVAVIRDSAIYKELEARRINDPARYNYTLVPVESATNGMSEVSSGAVDAMVVDEAASAYYYSEHGLSLRQAGVTDYSWNLCFASSTNSPLWESILNKALQLAPRERTLISYQFPTLGDKMKAEQQKRQMYRIAATGLIVTLLSIAGVILWNRTLRKQISDHLRELVRVRTSHAQAAKALDESEERFRVLVESSNDIIWEMDRYGSYTYVSPRVRDILGYTPEELIGKSSLSLLSSADSARKMTQLRQRTVGSTIDCEINTYTHKDGRKVILESSGMAYADNIGELAGFRGVSRDITDRLTNENALRRSEERFRNLVETTSDWIWEVDTEGFYTYLSPQSADLLGYTPEELMGRHFTALMPEKEAERLKLFFGRISETGKPIHSQVTNNRHRDNRSIVLETSAVPFYDEGWQIQGYRGISRDITDRVAAERKLEFERNLFRSFMEHAPDLIYFKDAKGRFIEVNTAKTEELRRPAQDIIGRTDFDFLPEQQARQTFADETEVMRTGKPLQKEEMITTPDGDRWYLTTKVPRCDENGNVVGTFGTSWDITYRKKADEELRQLRALLSNTIDSMPSILVGVDATGRIIQWNRFAEKASGLPASQAIGLHLRNAFPELAKEMVKVERAIRERTSQVEERIPIEKDQHVRYQDITVFPLEGDTEGAVIRVDDVTDRVMIEDSIRNIVEGVAAVGRRFFSSMVAQLCKTLDADFTYISEFVDDDSTTMRTIAVSDNGTIGPNFEYELSATPCCLVMNESRCIHVADVRRQYPETELLEAQGIDSYIGIPLQDSENKPLGIMVAMYRKPVEEVDFALSIMRVFAGRTAAELERLQATKELIAFQNLLKNIIDSMPSILIGVGADGNVMQWNREAEKASGVEAARAHGQPLSNVFAQMSPDLEDLSRKLLKKGAQYHERLHCELKGAPRIVDVTVYPIATESDDGAVIRLDDVTDRVRIEEMMVQSEKMMSVGGLAAGMAHEINNPLAGILQNMQVIRNRIMHSTNRNVEEAEAAGTTLEAIQHYMNARGLIKMLDSTAEAGHRAAKIVDNMLSFSRKDESYFAPHNLEEIIERSIELASNDYNLKKRFDFRHIRIIRDFDPLQPVPCEASQIQQVLLNLLSNSAQAMAGRNDADHEPQITIRLRNSPEMALIEVEDNGPGMDAETRKRAFDPFFTTKEVGHGTGLGLSVSFFIITENHGGTMHLDSAPGQGARFSIRLPFEHRTELWGLRL